MLKLFLYVRELIGTFVPFLKSGILNQIDKQQVLKVQLTFYRRLRERKLSTRFFKALMQKLQAAQSRIKADMLSATSARTRSSKCQQIGYGPNDNYFSLSSFVNFNQPTMYVV